MNFADVVKTNDSYMFKNWLDKVYSGEITGDIFAQEPSFDDIPLERQAYWAGVAHHISNILNIPPPKWVFKDKYFLDEPLFGMNAKGMLRLVLLVESPTAFRIRNIFVSENALSRV